MIARRWRPSDMVKRTRRSSCVAAALATSAVCAVHLAGAKRSAWCTRLNAGCR